MLSTQKRGGERESWGNSTLDSTVQIHRKYIRMCTQGLERSLSHKEPLLLFQRMGFNPQHPHSNSQPSVIPVPQDPKSSSGYGRHQTCPWYIDIHSPKISVHINQLLNSISRNAEITQQGKAPVIKSEHPSLSPRTQMVEGLELTLASCPLTSMCILQCMFVLVHIYSHVHTANRAISK